MPVATLTSKGQITIPLPVRERLRLRAGDRVDFVFEADGRVSLEPRRIPFETLRGVLRDRRKKPLGPREIDKAIQKAVLVRWRRAAGAPRK